MRLPASRHHPSCELREVAARHMKGVKGEKDWQRVVWNCALKRLGRHPKLPMDFEGGSVIHELRPVAEKVNDTLTAGLSKAGYLLSHLPETAGFPIVVDLPPQTLVYNARNPSDPASHRFDSPLQIQVGGALNLIACNVCQSWFKTGEGLNRHVTRSSNCRRRLALFKINSLNSLRRSLPALQGDPEKKKAALDRIVFLESLLKSNLKTSYLSEVQDPGDQREEDDEVVVPGEDEPINQDEFEDKESDEEAQVEEAKEEVQAEDKEVDEELQVNEETQVEDEEMGVQAEDKEAQAAPDREDAVVEPNIEGETQAMAVTEPGDKAKTKTEDKQIQVDVPEDEEEAEVQIVQFVNHNSLGNEPSANEAHMFSISHQQLSSSVMGMEPPTPSAPPFETVMEEVLGEAPQWAGQEEEVSTAEDGSLPPTMLTYDCVVSEAPPSHLVTPTSGQFKASEAIKSGDTPSSIQPENTQKNVQMLGPASPAKTGVDTVLQINNIQFNIGASAQRGRPVSLMTAVVGSILFTLLFLKLVQARGPEHNFTALDCRAPQDLQSFEAPSHCHGEEEYSPDAVYTKEDIHILQRLDFFEVEAWVCSGRKYTTVHHCGMLSYEGLVAPPSFDEKFAITPAQCRQATQDRLWKGLNGVTYDVRKGDNSFSYLDVGELFLDHGQVSCQGSDTVIAGTVYHGVIRTIQQSIKIERVKVQRRFQEPRDLHIRLE